MSGRLLAAIRDNDIKLVGDLLESGHHPPDVNEVERDGEAALHAACGRGNDKIVSLLIGTGKANVNVCDTNRDTPLAIAATSGHTKCCELLLKEGALIGDSALHLPSYSGHVEVVALLAKSGASLEMRDCHFQTPLHLACRGGSLDVVKLLVSLGANVNAESNLADDVKLPIGIARKEGREEIVAVLSQQSHTGDSQKSLNDVK